MIVRPFFAILAAGTLLAGCQPPPPATSVSVSPTTGAATVTTPATNTVAVGPGGAVVGSDVAVTPLP